MYRKADYYSKLAKQHGYPARSVFKLQQIHQKFHFLYPNAWVLDLGCAPGAWTLYAAKQVGPKGRVVGIDVTCMSNTRFSFPSTVSFVQDDVFHCPRRVWWAVLIPY